MTIRVAIVEGTISMTGFFIIGISACFFVLAVWVAILSRAVDDANRRADAICVALAEIIMKLGEKDG